MYFLCIYFSIPASEASILDYFLRTRHSDPPLLTGLPGGGDRRLFFHASSPLPSWQIRLRLLNRGWKAAPTKKAQI
jgi:hypothetical protein